MSVSKIIMGWKPWQIISGLIGVVLVGIYIYSIVGTSNVVLKVNSLSNNVVIGAPFEIEASVKNISRDPLAKVKLSLSLPPGLIFADAPNLKINTVDLGEVGSNGSHKESFRVVAVPTAGVTILEPVATLRYSLGSIKGIFEQKEKLSLDVVDLGLDLQLTGPAQVISGAPFDLMAVYSRGNIYTSESENIPVLKLRFDYPGVLAATYSVPKTGDKISLAKQLDPKTFSLGMLAPGESGEVDLQGTIDLPEGSSFKVTANIVMNIMGRDYVVIAKDFSVALSPSPLSVALYAAANNPPIVDSSKAIFNAGDTLNYLLVYKNQSDTPFDNVTLKVKFTGSMYDFSSISGNGIWNSLTRTITWDYSNIPDFRSLAPGTAGNINFTIRLAADYPIRRVNDKNFMIKAEARIESPTVQKDSGASKTSSLSTLENKISGRVRIESKGFFRDAASLILNDGPWPPRVNQPTDFTIHWVLTNYSTDLTNIEVRAELPDGYTLTDVVKSNIASMPKFDEDKGEIYWKIDKLYATTGITSDSPEAIFQVRATPANAGDYMPILGLTRVTATDTFTGLQINSFDDPITSRLPDDPSVKEGEGKVVN